jgi:hypothetical protein
MNDFKKNVMDFNMTIYTPVRIPDPKHLGIFMMTRVIPRMKEDGDVAFAWHWARSDSCVYNAKELAMETAMYKKKGLKCDKGDSTWFYEWTAKNGKKHRCLMNTEIWYKEGEEHYTSPFAYLFNQIMGAGLHITRCRFEDV